MRSRRRRVAIMFGLLLLAVVGLRWRSVRERRQQASPAPTRTAQTPGEAVKLRVPEIAAAPVSPSAPAAAPAGDADGGTVVDQLFALRAVDAQIQASTLLARNAEEAERNIDKYCERASHLDPASGFKDIVPASSDDDAGPFLAPLLDWFIAKAPPPLYAPQRHGLLHLPETLSARIDAAGGHWPAALTVADVAELDFSWMTQALQYGHWSLTTAGPIAEQGQNADLSVVAPDFILLLDWAKLRYVKAVAQNDLPRASREVRHLAYLVHTTGGTIADNVSLRMTGLLGRVPNLPPEVEPADPRVLTETDDLSRAGAAFFWPGVSPEVAKRALACAPSPCSSFLEGAFLRGTLGQLSPVDTDDDFWALGNESCDAKMMELVRHARARSSGSALELLHTMSQLPLERLFGKDVQPHIDRKDRGANRVTVRPKRSLPREENTKS